MKMNAVSVKLYALLFCLATCVAAQEAEDAAEPAAAAKPALREQTIYVPYKRLRNVFEEQGRGVFLPYEKFQELWQKARAGQPQPIDDRPPVGAIVTEIENEATVQQDVISVAANLQIELLGKGWHEVPLRLTDAAIRSATIEDQTARVIFHPKQGYKLLIKNEDDEPQQITLALEYSKAYSKSPGQNSVSFQAPQAPINRWRIRIPQAGVKVNIHPMIAATEEPADPDVAAEEEEVKVVEETVVLAFIGAAPSIRVDWTPKSEGASGLEALATVQSQQQVTIDEGVVRTSTRLTYNISRAELSQLVLEVPADQKVTRVLDPNVRQWDVDEDDDKQTITVQLFQPARGAQNLTVELEKFSDEEALADTRAPIVQAVGVGRQQGIVVVRLGEELRAEATVKNGLLQLDAGELPQHLRNVAWSFAYRYAALPFDLALNVEKVEPRIRVQQLVEVYVEPEQMTLDTAVIFDIQHAGVFQLEFDVPEGYEVRRVEGRALGDAPAAVIDARHLEGDNNTRLKVNLARKAIGRVGLFISLHRTLNDPNLLTPTGDSSELALPVPRVATDVEDVAGRLVIHGPESLQITAQELSGLRNISISEARQNVPSVRDGRFSALREILAFVFTRQETDLTVATERRRPQVTARQLLTASIESGVVKFQATFFYDILYSGVQSLRIDVPEDLAGEIHLDTTGISKTPLDPQPDDVADGYVAWNISGETEFLGERSFVLSWNQDTPELGVGKSADYALPVLRPMDVDRTWGQVVVSKHETLDISAAEGHEGLRPIDPQHDLMPGVSVEKAARAFEFQEDWSLTMTATRYELEEVKRTSIERALVRMVVTRSDQISVQALYRIRSAVQRLAVELPAESQFDMDMLYINGELKTPERGNQGELFIPLVNQNPEVPFVLELRYTGPGSQSKLDLPVFPSQPPLQSQPAVQQVQLSVYLPDELAVLHSDGPWTNHEDDWYSRLNRLQEQPASDAHLVDWVTDGVGMNSPHAKNFATDGRLYSFTTLRPAPPPDGSLRLVAWDGRVLDLFVFGSLALVGLVCVRQTVNTKLIVITLIMVGLVLVGVFAPTFAMQLIDPNLLIALVVLLMVWLVAGVVLRHPQSATPAAATATAEAANAEAIFSGMEQTEESQADESPADEADESQPADDSPFFPTPPRAESSDESGDDGENKEGEEGGRNDA
jgi:hypothetical protein